MCIEAALGFPLELVYRNPNDIRSMTEPCKDSSNENIDRLKSRLLEQLRAGEIQSLFEFLATVKNGLPVEHLSQLVEVDIEFRRSNGEETSLEDYYDHLPELAPSPLAQTVTKVINHQTTAAETEIFDVPSDANKRQLIETGDTIDDFELIAELGRGSFATVFLARQISMQRLVALKVSTDHGMEAQTLAQLDHPHIVRVFDQRKARDYDLQLLYMQYLEGGTLLDVLKRVINSPESELSGKLFVQCVDDAVIARGASPSYESAAQKSYVDSDWEQTICRIGYSLARALEYAHQKGVLHRDIKPANVLISSDCSVKLADFNISSADTVVGEFVFGGSLVYMSPEQVRAFNKRDDFSADDLTDRCDIYSLGVMLYQLLKRELPFYALSKSRSAGGLESMIAERENSIERVGKSLKTHSPLLQKALTRCLQPNIDDRPTSARDLANQLKIGLDRDAEQFLFPAKRNWTLFFQQHFYIVCVVVNLLFNALAAAFVFRFNLLDSVPKTSHDIFWWVQLCVNGIVFPLAIGVFVKLTWMVPKALRLCLNGQHTKVPDLRLAMHRTLSAGHIQAIICGSLWIVAGALYPILLTIFGCNLSVSDWLDFITSHALAGIAITALTFFATTYLSLRIWLPVLIQNSFAEEVVCTVTSGLNSLISKIPVYQLFAVSVPLLAIALLVIFGDVMAGSKFPLTVISLFGLLAIPIVLFGGNRIRTICEKLLVIFRYES